MQGADHFILHAKTTINVHSGMDDSEKTSYTSRYRDNPKLRFPRKLHCVSRHQRYGRQQSSPQIWVTPSLTVHKRQPNSKSPLACERCSASFKFSGEFLSFSSSEPGGKRLLRARFRDFCGHLGVKHRTKRGQRQSKSSSARPEEPSSESHHFGAFIADSVPRIRQASRRSVPDLELVQNKRLLTTHLFIAWGTILSHDQGLYCSFFDNQVYIRKWVNSWFIIW